MYNEHNNEGGHEIDTPERITDPLDRAAQLEDAERENARLAVQNRAKPQQVKNADGTWPHEDCVECGEPIGEKRLEALGTLICIECATYNEKISKRR